MAEIYRAKTFGAAGFEKEFAIKLILPGLVNDTEFVEMFINEAKIAVNLYHSNVVQVFDLGELENQYYIAMEYVHGMDLLDVLARCAGTDLKVPLDLVLFIMTEMLKGLDFAHRAKDSYGEELNIIHRDVSPSNVLISYAGDVKLGDFGVAKAAVQRTLTESGTLKGKVGYMSPEQVVGDKIDQRSDIFSAGVIFFEALSMNRLFIGNSDLDVMLKVRDANIDDELEKAQPIPARLEEIVRKALSKHREERYQSAGEFYQALVDFCFQHRIQTNANHLSNFMRRLFAEEIEREKSQKIDADSSSDRLRAIIVEQEEKRSQQQLLDGAYQSVVESVAELSDVFSEIDYDATGEASPLSKTSQVSHIGQAPEFGETEVSESALERRYRYRDNSGLIYGPMGFKTIIALFSERIPRESDRVSINNGEWEDPFDVEEFQSELAIAEKATRSNPLGKGVLIRKKSTASVSVSESVTTSHVLPLMEQSSNSLAAESSVSSRVEAIEEVRDSIREMREKLVSYEGDFDGVSFSRLLARLHRDASTGNLVVMHDEIRKSIYFSKGEPIFVESNKDEELLGFYLRTKNIISQEQLDDGLARLSEWGGRLGDALVAIGAIPAHEIFQHLSQQMRDKILDVFSWGDGRFEYFEGQEPETHGYPLGIDTYSVIAEGCFDFAPLVKIKAFYEERKNVAMFIRTDLGFTTEELRLSSKMLRIVKKIKNDQTVKSLIDSMANEDEAYVYRVLYLLHQVQYLTFEVTSAEDGPMPLVT